MKKLFQILISSFVLILATTAVYAEQQKSNLGLFVSVLDEPQVLASKNSIKELLTFSEQFGIKKIFIQVYRANKAWFPSQHADQSDYKTCSKQVGEDPLTYFIKEAHKNNIEVHAWLNLLSLSKNAKAPLLKKYGTDILTKNKQPKEKLEDYLIDNQYFLEPGEPTVRHELGSIVEELVKNYHNLDGIQFDYIRYPDTKPAYGYTNTNLKRFKKKTGIKEVNEKDSAWQQWKRDQATELLKELVKRTREIRPNLQISTTGCVSYIRAHDEAFQDWPTWVNNDIVDFVTVMNYPDDPATYQKYIKDAINHVTAKYRNKLNFAVGAYKLVNAPDKFAEEINLCRQANAGDCVILSYGSLKQNPTLTESLKNR